MNINVLIVEDNPITAQDLSEILQESGMDVSAICYSAEDALRKIESNPPDVALVDIQLKDEMIGIEMVREINKTRRIPVIYLTANSDKETVDKALETKPASFLTKPFEDKDVIIAIELAFKNHFFTKLEDSSTEERLPNCPYIFLKSGNKFEKVRTEDILFLEADGSYSKVVTNQKEYVLTGNLNQFLSQLGELGDRFLRVHRSYLVNLDSITGLDNDYIFISDHTLPIGRSHRNDVKNILRRIS